MGALQCCIPRLFASALTSSFPLDQHRTDESPARRCYEPPAMARACLLSNNPPRSTAFFLVALELLKAGLL
jgi:hypothetical protein